MGRFVSKYSIGLLDGDNVYAYAPNPIGWIYPYGLTPDDTTIFYHAGDIQGAIDPSKGRKNLDFNPQGQGGFYVTTNKNQAEDWANKRNHPTVTVFDVPNKELEKLNTKTFSSADGEWKDFVKQGRQGTLQHDYDVVSGPMVKNPQAVRKSGTPVAEGCQFAVFSGKAAQVFDKAKR